MVVVIVVVGTTDVVFVVDVDVTILVVLGNLLVDDFVAIETTKGIEKNLKLQKHYNSI